MDNWIHGLMGRWMGGDSADRVFDFPSFHSSTNPFIRAAIYPCSSAFIRG
jgi:hypothetical protein